MDTFEAIEQRRAVKRYDPDHVMTPAEVEKLLSLAMLSPTAFNIQHWRFVVVQDKALRKQIQEVSWNQAQVSEASLLVVMCADKKAWEKNAARYWKDAPEPVQDFLVPAIAQYYEGRETRGARRVHAHVRHRRADDDARRPRPWATTRARWTASTSTRSRS